MCDRWTMEGVAATVSKRGAPDGWSPGVTENRVGLGDRIWYWSNSDSDSYELPQVQEEVMVTAVKFPQMTKWYLFAQH